MTCPRARSQGNSGNGDPTRHPSLSAASSPISSRDTRYRYRDSSARAFGAPIPIASGTLLDDAVRHGYRIEVRRRLAGSGDPEQPESFLLF